MNPTEELYRSLSLEGEENQHGDLVNQSQTLAGVSTERAAETADLETGQPTKQPDGYWVKMGRNAVEALAFTWRPDLTPQRKEVIAQYLGGILDDAYNMGIRLGAAQERLATHSPKEGE